MRTLAVSLVLVTLLGRVAMVVAQPAGTTTPATHAPAGDAPAATAPAAAAAATPPAAAQEAPAAAAPATGEAAPAPLVQATEAQAEPAPATTTSEEDELARQKREADRARIRLLLARARAERTAADQQSAAQAQAPAAQPEPAAVRHGDAGAAIAVGLSIELPWHTEHNFDLFSSNDIGERFGLWATYDVLSLGERAFVAAGAGFDVESIESKNLLGGALDTTLTATVLYGTAVARYVPTDWIQPHVRLSAGAQLVRSELAFGDVAFRNNGDLPFGSLGAGFTLRSPTRLFESSRGELASLSVGVMIEGGYTLAQPLEMKVDGSGPDDRDIALIESDLGELDRSGPFMRISLVARFF